MLPLLGIAAGLIGAAGKGIKARKQNKLADKVVIPDADYTVSPYAQNILGEANRLKNAQMPGMAQASQNIMGNQANAVGSINRNASSSSQALALLGGVQGNTNQAFQGLAEKQNQYSMSMLNNYNNANMGMTDEMDKIFQDKVRNQQMKMQEKNALRQAASNNTAGAFDSVMSGITTAATIYGNRDKKVKKP